MPHSSPHPNAPQIGTPPPAAGRAGKLLRRIAQFLAVIAIAVFVVVVLALAAAALVVALSAIRWFTLQTLHAIGGTWS